MGPFGKWMSYKLFILICAMGFGYIIAAENSSVREAFLLAISIPLAISLLIIGLGQAFVYKRLHDQVINNEALQTEIKEFLKRLMPFFSIMSYMQIYLLYNFTKLFDFLVWSDFEKITSTEDFLKALPQQFKMVAVLFIVFLPIFLSFQNFFFFFNAEKIWENFKRDLKL